MYSVI